MDMAPLIIITTPIFLPVVQAYGVDPVHFGVILVLNLGIGLVTPPVGAVLFVGCARGKDSGMGVDQEHLALLHGHAHRSHARHLHPSNFALAAIGLSVTAK